MKPWPAFHLTIAALQALFTIGFAMRGDVFNGMVSATFCVYSVVMARFFIRHGA